MVMVSRSMRFPTAPIMVALIFTTDRFRPTIFTMNVLTIVFGTALTLLAMVALLTK